MDTNQKVNQIMQALQMREETDILNNMGGKLMTVTIKGTAREALVAELVKVLTAAEATA